MTASRLAHLLLSLWLTACGLACENAATVTAPTSTTSPVTETFASRITIGGGASRAFSVAESGAVSVTLTDVGPPSGVVVGLGIGIPRSDSVGCNLSQAVLTAGSSDAQLTATVEAGSYCARIYDVGNLTGEVSFSITIMHP